MAGVLGISMVSVMPSSAIVVLISDLVPADPTNSIEAFLAANFSNVTEVRHGDYSNTTLETTQDAIFGTGVFAGSGAADVVILGRSLGSGGYANGLSDLYNTLPVPVVSFTAYTARGLGNRLGWHTGSATSLTSVLGDESTVTMAGVTILGLAEGAYDLVSPVSELDSTFNGLSAGVLGYGGGQILATIGPDVLAAYWPAGSLPGDEVNSGLGAGGTFPGQRLLFNLDNEPNAGNDGVNDFTNLTAVGTNALVTALANTTPLVAVPEPSTSLLGLLAGLALAMRRRPIAR